MKAKFLFPIYLLLFAAVSHVSADVVTLKDGKALNGTFVGSDGKTIEFKTDFGTMSVERSKVASITFGNAGAPPTAAATPAPAAATAPPAKPAAPSGPVTLPAGTLLLVKMASTVSSKTQAGTSFNTVLEYDLGYQGRVVAKAGTVIKGTVTASEQARRIRGQSMLHIQLTSIELNGKSVAITTSGHNDATPASISKAAKGAAAGAAIGAIAGDAGKGAAIGATVGAMRRPDTITVNAGSLVEFTLTNPVTL